MPGAVVHAARRFLTGEAFDGLLAAGISYLASLAALVVMEAGEFADFSTGQLLGLLGYSMHRFVVLQHAAIAGTTPLLSKRSATVVVAAGALIAVGISLDSVFVMGGALALALCFRDTSRFCAATAGRSVASSRASLLTTAAIVLGATINPSPVALLVWLSVVEIAVGAVVLHAVKGAQPPVTAPSAAPPSSELGRSGVTYLAAENLVSTVAFTGAMVLAASVVDPRVFASLRALQLAFRPAAAILDASILPLARRASERSPRRATEYAVSLLASGFALAVLTIRPVTEQLEQLLDVELPIVAVLLFGLHSFVRIDAAVSAVALRKRYGYGTVFRLRLVASAGYVVLVVHLLGDPSLWVLALDLLLIEVVYLAGCLLRARAFDRPHVATEDR